MAFFRRKPKAEQPPADPKLDPTADASGAAAEAAVPETPAAETSAAEAPAAEEPPKKKGLFARLRDGLKKTNQVLNTDVRDLFKRDGELLDDAFLDRLFAVLIRTDMGAAPAQEIREEIQSKYRGRVVHMEDILADVKAKLNELTAQEEVPIQMAESGPTVIMVVGVNGSGKTTSIAKLSQMYVDQGKSVVLGAGDTFRAAAVEQLTIWSERIGTAIVKGEPNCDPASVAHRAVAFALENNTDICIIDTAGRLQTQSNLMDELNKVRRVVTKQIPDAPHETLLVLDATAGQNGISQARGFTETAGCTGIVLAKLDGTAKGGVIIPIRQQFGLPVKYIGVGEQSSDLAAFDSTQFVEALFDGLLAQANQG